jgi:hypothetical protein
MAFTFLDLPNAKPGKDDPSADQKFHIPLERSMNARAAFGDQS